MTINWDSIRYIFQLPLKWYKDINDRVFNSYGTNFVVVKEGYYGGTEIGIDSDAFAQDVNAAVDLSGYVKTVNSTSPDENGNVELSGFVETVNGMSPDANGNVELSGFVETVNGMSPDANGNVELSGVTDNSLKVVTGVTWNGTQIAVTSQTWKIQDGRLTATTSNADTYIDTVPFSL